MKVWTGDDGNGAYVPDNRYIASLYIKDQNGVTGLTKTVQIVVVSLKIDVKNITLNPSALNTVPQVKDSVLTVITHRVEVKNDSGSTLRPSLQALGWPTNFFNSTTNYLSAVYAMNQRTFLNPDGSDGIKISSNHDDAPLIDEDPEYISRYAQDATHIVMAQCYQGVSGAAASTTDTSRAVLVGDGDIANDWSLDRNVLTSFLRPLERSTIRPKWMVISECICGAIRRQLGLPARDSFNFDGTGRSKFC